MPNSRRKISFAYFISLLKSLVVADGTELFLLLTPDKTSPRKIVLYLLWLSAEGIAQGFEAVKLWFPSTRHSIVSRTPPFPQKHIDARNQNCGVFRKIIHKAQFIISSNAPVSESIIKPLTTISFGTSGWVLMVSTVFLTDSGVSLKPSNQWCRSMPHF